MADKQTQTAHLYQDKKGTIHLCEGDFAGAPNRSPFLVWTKCGKDVPANKSFTSNHEAVDCYN